MVVLLTKFLLNPVVNKACPVAGKNSKFAGAVRMSVPLVEKSLSDLSVITIFPNDEYSVGKLQPVTVSDGAVTVTCATVLFVPIKPNIKKTMRTR